MFKFCSILIISSMLFVSAYAEEAVHGVMMVVKGDIKVTSAKDKTTEAAKVGKKVIPGDSITAGPDSRAKIVMTDKNVLNISPDSKVVIEKYSNNGADKNVELKVEYGKIRASVEQKYDGEKSKFNVKTPSAVAGVRGTDFLTSYNAGSKQSQVITFSGTVAMGQPGPGGKIMNAVFVQPGQTSSASDGKAPEKPRAMPPAELNQMKNESSADTASTKKSDQAADKKEAKKDEDKKDDKKDDKKEDKKDAKKDDAKKDDSAKKDDGGAKKDDAAAKKDDGAAKKDAAAGDKPAADKPADKSASGDKPASAAADTAPAKPAAPGPDSAAAAPSANGPGPAPSDARAPASLPPVGGGSMISGADLPTAPGGIMPSMPAPTAGPIMPPPTMNMPVAPIPNTFINNAIQNQKSATTIIITK